MEYDYKTWHEKHKNHKGEESYSKFDNATMSQNGEELEFTEQDSDETIIIRNSCDVDVQTTDTKAAVNLQVSLQLAIALVVSITVGDTDNSKAFAQDIFQKLSVNQISQLKTIVDNSKSVKITTTETDISVNVQALLQVLLALVVRLDVL